MYRYPVVIHFHRKNGDYAACSFSRKQADVKENLYYENDYFGAKFSFTVTSAERLDTLTFSVEIDGKTKDYLLRFNYYPLLTEVWILDGDETVYYSENPAIASPCYKDRNPFAFDKAFHSESFDHHWGYQGELGIVSLTTRQALNSGLQQLQQSKLLFMKIQVTTRRFGKPLILSVGIAIHTAISTIPLVFGV